MALDGGPHGGAAAPTGAPAAAAGRHSAKSGPPTLQEFNSLEIASAAEILGACLDIPEWVTQVAAGRPYADLRSLQEAAAAAAAGITWEQVSGALDRHPRIGETTSAGVRTGTESAWSAAEQAGVDAGQAAAMADGNRAYERRFGHIFLICAAGLSGGQILANLNSRLAGDAATEKPVVIDELRKIGALRLAKAVSL